MNRIASLIIRADSRGLDTATSELDRLERQGGRTERATDGVASSIKGMVLASVSVGAMTAAISKLISVSSNFQNLNASLVTATGSAENAAIAFQAIQDFATKTPYDLNQATDSFLKLVNLGLTPSEEAMMSYGNTASALGKNLNDMVEAVADAATGEFERLKEFGIKASKEGDRVKLTFRGITKEVGNNASEIEDYLIALGNNEFAGQMEKQMATLGGAISNFNDEFTKVVSNVAQMGASDIIEDAFRAGTDALTELNAMLASGELQARMDAFFGKFTGYAEDVDRSLRYITDIFEAYSDEWGDDATSSVDEIISAFTDMPENIRAAIQLVVVEIASLVDAGRIFGQAMLDIIVVKFDQLAAEAKVYGKSMANALNPFSDEYDLRGELDAVISEYSAKTGDIWAGGNEQLARTADIRRASISSILDERDESLKSTDEQISAADKLREQWDKTNEARQADTTDKLAQFKVGGDASTDEDGGDSKAADKAAKQFDKLVESLRNEEEVISQSYEARRKMIFANTDEESEARKKLMERLDAQRDEQYSKMARDRVSDVEKIRESLLSEEEALLESYERKREIVLENEYITEEQRQELILGLQQDYVEKTKQLEMERIGAVLNAGEQMFSGLAGLAKAFAGEQSTAYRAMFAVSQAFALTDATMKMYQAIQGAWVSAPFPANLGPVAIATAETGANVAAIASQSFSGAYDKGGMIPTGKVGLVGEIGPELVSGPARVVGRKDTEALMKKSAPQEENKDRGIRIINSFDTGVINDHMSSPEGEQVMLNVIRRNRTVIRSMVG